jgi:hypothetical protein
MHLAHRKREGSDIGYQLLSDFSGENTRRISDLGSAKVRWLTNPADQALSRFSEAVALFDDLPILNERPDLVPQLKNAMPVMHQHGLLQDELLHGARQSVPLNHYRFAQPTNNVLVVGRAIEDTRSDFHQPIRPEHA